MWRFGYDTTASFLLTIALLSMLATVLVWQQHKTGKTIVVWLWAGIFGILLGCAGTFAVAKISKDGLGGTSPTQAIPVGEASSESGESAASPGGGGSGMGGGMPGGMGGRGMFGSPRPKRDLTQVVRKVTLLTSEVGITLSPEQASALIEALKDVEVAEKMTDEQAQAKHDEILAILDEDQKAQLDTIGLPRGSRPRGERPPEDANPFGQETNSEALKVLRQRFDRPQ